MKSFIKKLLCVITLIAFTYGVYFFGCVYYLTPFYISDYVDIQGFFADNFGSFAQTADVPPHISADTYDEIFNSLSASSALLSASSDSADTVSENSLFILSLDNLNVCYKQLPEAASFVRSCSASSNVAYSYEETPDVSLIGSQAVTVCATDEIGNTVKSSAVLNVLPVLPKITVELGDDLPVATDFLIDTEREIRFLSGTPSSWTDIGEYDVSLMLDGEYVVSQLSIVDTKAPTAVSITKTGCLGKSYLPEDFVGVITDASPVTVSFISEPDWNLEGEQTVSVFLEDAAGNSSCISSTLEQIIDTTGPLITASSATVTVGSTISYMNLITLSDNVDSSDELTLNVDTSAVDLKTVGNYTVHISATDTSGNTTEKDITINVVEQAPAVTTPTYTQADVNALAQEVLSTIITDDMTDEQKVYAIWHWARYNIYYTHNFTIDNVQSGTYRALTNRKSNCFGYACVIKTMLDLCGIDNMVICVPSRPHYWNIVNIGNGYYHVDATPRIDGTLIYMWNDATLKAYSDSNGGTHAYDRSLYPTVN